MRKSIFLIVLFFLSSQFLFSKNITLTDAVNQGLVTVQSAGEGGHTGKCLKISIKNLQKKKLEITIPAGLIFQSVDSTRQSLMLTQEKVLVLESQKKRTTKMYAACVEAPKGSPGLGNSFNIGSLATGHLLQVAQFIAKENLYKNDASQYAVWAISNGKRLENIDHKKLGNFVADLLGKPRPDYVVVHRTTSEPGAPAYREAPSILKGRFQFTLLEEKRLTFGLYTKEGVLKIAFFENKKQIRGLHKFNFTFKVFNMPSGDYLLKLMNEAEVIEQREVSF